MKGILILFHWFVSFSVLLCVGSTEGLPLAVVFGAILWLFSASMLMNYAERRGWLKKLNKYFRDL
ncbi:MAG: hypothetical protein LBB62_05115 [Proteiniphilum sp.]|nr:hypothetical protein [Proteiniphilum sp.]